MGDSDMSCAIKMKFDESSNEWVTQIDSVPANTQYRYFAADPNHVESSARHMTSYWYLVRVPDASQKEVVSDDCTQLIRFQVYKGAQDVRVCGSIKELGHWKADQALRLDKKGDTKWEAVVPIPSESLFDFQYKYVADGVFEDGGNRISDVSDVEPQPEGNRCVSNLQAVFNGLLVRFLIFHPIGVNERMVITGGHPAFGNWNPVNQWCRMGLGNERTLLTGVRGRCWEATFPAPPEDYREVEYRYVILNEEQNQAVWESEPNRRISFFPGAVSQSGKNGGFRRREFTQFDGNFVAKELLFDFIPPCLFIGPYPQCKDDVERMKAAGVTGVVNVQTQKDIMQRMVNMDLMRGLYHEQGIEFRHVPIEDFNGQDLAERVKFAAKATHELVELAKSRGQEPRVYIHCTAGMGRAPATACVYLVWKHGHDLDSARAHVKKHRPIVAPNYNAMKLALQRGLD
ncbi:hypothetical protein GUITHDRAFT_116460 [Guillardia theta CCMP2712]|uniref:Uncharacterized protein n=1 Tax=Guillardia theta (strain CCMP2712) TaxID=905079 RepID=L1IMN9_GUITC|nr:hypothetical protein GUITHDRAFT_116460 [Guillardia theta CCMP2712]EKX37347.1 hypothetical protein GUITHDRAFT_116460 [Guillardia theta CCMP2712]|eukprot:XP_005824327.1 hypothetical protein GUITHDRAFT_116460 [Guillardia theta CCMP2712]